MKRHGRNMDNEPNIRMVLLYLLLALVVIILFVVALDFNAALHVSHMPDIGDPDFMFPTRFILYYNLIH